MAVIAGPTSPKGANDRDSKDNRSPNRPGLDAPPPPPPGQRTVDMSTLAGGDPQAQSGTPPTGDLAGMVVQRAAMLDQGITQLAQMLPAFVPMAAQMSQMLKQGIVASLQQAQQGSPPASGGAPGMTPPPMQPGAPMPAAGLAGQ